LIGFNILVLNVIVCKVEKYFLFKNFTYIIFNTKNNIGLIIDPAWNLELIEEKIKENNIQLKGILVTHNHIDHVDLVKNLVEKYDCSVYIGETELNYNKFQTKNLIPIKTESSFSIGDIDITPIFTPGHTQGSVCYLIGDNFFSGDTLFIEGCGVCFDKKDSPSQLYKSMQKIKKTVPTETKIYPGHSYGKQPGIFMKELLQDNIYLNFKKENDFITYRMRKGQKSIFNFK
jgi:hydroxyacylglutathione hydrolase